MSQQPNQPAAKFDLREQMPETSKWVDAKRQEHGAAFVNDCIRRGMPKLVYGRDSLKTWLGANLLPLRLLNPIVWRDLRGVIDRSDYPPPAAAAVAKTAARRRKVVS